MQAHLRDSSECQAVEEIAAANAESSSVAVGLCVLAPCLAASTTETLTQSQQVVDDLGQAIALQ